MQRALEAQWTLERTPSHGWSGEDHHESLCNCHLDLLHAMEQPPNPPVRDGRNDNVLRLAGLGPLAGKIWRIGIMGHTARPENVKKLLSALKAIL